MIYNEETHRFPRMVCYFALEITENPNENIFSRAGWVIGKSSDVSGPLDVEYSVLMGSAMLWMLRSLSGDFKRICRAVTSFKDDHGDKM